MVRLIPTLVIILILVLFALSNRQDVALGFWPTDFAIQAPLSVAILVGMAIAFFLGAAVVWIDKLGLGRRARRAEAQVARLQAQLAEAELRRTPIATSRSLTDPRLPEPVLPPPEA
ncbi:MAG: LapA family protein [Proteobacteria bacterium]|nr:LapA family protein [Pseudomonadota bacterium]